MEVHGWFNVFKIRGPNPVGPSTPEHPSRTFTQLVRQKEDGNSGSIPAARRSARYLLNVALDLIRNYDLDGINFDFIRYPGREFPDGEPASHGTARG